MRRLALGSRAVDSGYIAKSVSGPGTMHSGTAEGLPAGGRATLHAYGRRSWFVSTSLPTTWRALGSRWPPRRSSRPRWRWWDYGARLARAATSALVPG